LLPLKKALNPNLITFWTSTDYRTLDKARYRVLYGGRGSSKSHELCTMLVIKAYQSKKKILCTRAFQARIQDSVKDLLEQKISYLGLDAYFNIQKNKITCVNGSEFLFYGLARNTAEIKGLENIDIAYIEEAQYITKEMMRLLAPTVRKQGSEIWVAFNPLGYYDYAYQEFVLNAKESYRVRKINYTENPFISDTLLEEIEELKSDEDFEHIYLGEPKRDSDNSIFKREWLDACIDAFEKLGISKPNDNAVIGYDVADSGTDTNAICLNIGNELQRVEEWHGKENELDISTNKALSFFPSHVPYSKRSIIYDSIGVGAGVGVFLREARNKQQIKNFFAFVASGKVENPKRKYQILGSMTEISNEDYFANRKAQAWIELADRAKATYNAVIHGKPIDPKEVISFSSKINKTKLDNLFQQLTTPNKEEQQERKIKVESKKDLAKRGIPSPNLADACIMSFVKKRLAF